MRKILNVKAKAFMPVHVGGGEDHKLILLTMLLKGTGSIESISATC